MCHALLLEAPDQGLDVLPRLLAGILHGSAEDGVGCEAAGAGPGGGEAAGGGGPALARLVAAHRAGRGPPTE